MDLYRISRIHHILHGFESQKQEDLCERIHYRKFIFTYFNYFLYKRRKTFDFISQYQKDMNAIEHSIIESFYTRTICTHIKPK